MSKIFWSLVGTLCIAGLIFLSTRVEDLQVASEPSVEPSQSGAEPRPRGSTRTDLIALVTAEEHGLPGEGSSAFVQPGEDDVATVVEAARAALAGKLRTANQELAPLGYQVVNFRDAPTGGHHLVFRERAPCQRCWGLFILNRSPAARDIVVEAPHPLWDQFTPEMGIQAYLRLDARAFLMAGAHRYANGRDSPVSDMARNPRSVFQGVHELLTDQNSQVLQYHGFDESDHRDYPDVVLSDGGPRPHAGLSAMKSAIEAQGARAGIYDGRHWPELGATDNPQGQQSRSIGARFYHMEHDYAIRKDPARRTAMIEAAYAVLVGGREQ